MRLALLTLAALLAADLSIAHAEASSPAPPRRQSVWTVFNTVEAVVDDNYATVRVIADIGNRGPDPEFPFHVRVPDGAFVTGLTLVRDGETHEARIEDREAARQQYEEHKARQETGGLVEKRRGTTTYSFLVNVAEFTSVRATLTYEQYLAADRGVHNLSLEAPVSGFGEDLGARFDVVVRHSDGVAQAWGAPAAQVTREAEGLRVHHSVGPRRGDAATPFTASYAIDPTGDSGSLVATAQDGRGYFAHRFRVPADARDLPLDLVLVLDTSGSMSGLKIQQLRDAATQVVTRLESADRLHLVFFSGDASSPWRGLREATAETRRDAGNEIAALLAAGGTNIEAGIRRGFEAFSGVDFAKEEGRMPLLVFLTDGQASAGVEDRQELRRIAKQANRAGTSVFALAFGNDADWSLVHGLAADGNGVALRVPEGAGAEVDLRRFMAALTTPVLRDVKISYGSGIHPYPGAARTLFAGSELLVVGTFDEGVQRISGKVTGRSPDGARGFEFSQAIEGARGASFLPRLVAHHEIRRLQELIDAEGARPERVSAVKELALRHGFVTDYTSLVVTPDPRTRPEPVREEREADADVADARSSAGAPQAASAPPSGGWSGTSAPKSAALDRSAAASSPEPSPARDDPAPTASPHPPASTPGAGLLAALAALGAVAALAGRRARFR